MGEAPRLLPRTVEGLWRTRQGGRQEGRGGANLIIERSSHHILGTSSYPRVVVEHPLIDGWSQAGYSDIVLDTGINLHVSA